MTRTRARRHGPSPRVVRVVFILTGLYFGWRWAAGGHGPAWRHALQVLVTMLIAMTLVQSLRWWRTRRGKREGPMARFPWRDLILFKLLLVALALAAEYLLQHWMPPAHAQLVVGACLGTAIATGGPILHRRHNSPTRTTPPTTTSVPTP
ncbi:hypothetical protein [Kitasatospora sp. NBC_01266]|uniref:hypothetical protein n=1 Tax=Kitasatospora sp. NBC_01266 TaxID=2903572 RepID=UPI002E340CBE|nr:hypothetical protein [Kitasatospora sp. NBC_01266]